MQKTANQKRKQTGVRAAFLALAVCVVVLLGGVILLLFQLQTGGVLVRSGIATTRLVASTYSNTISCSGSIQPIATADVYIPASETVVSVAVADGAYVTQGDTLFTTENEHIEAEISGTITDLKVNAGMSGDDLGGQPAMRIADMNVLVGVVRVPQAAAPYVTVGSEGDVTVPSMPGFELMGTLLDISDEEKADSQNRLYHEAVIVFGDTGELSVASAIEAQIVIEDYGKVYYVPSSAVLERDGCSYVDVVYTNNTIERHQVTHLGETGDGQKIIAGDALAEGTTIRADLGE